MERVNTTTHWYIYRDDRPRVKLTHANAAKEDLARLVTFLEECLVSFKNKTARDPHFVGVPSSFPMDIERAMSEKGMKVIHNLPGWATEEIWIGWEEV